MDAFAAFLDEISKLAGKTYRLGKDMDWEEKSEALRKRHEPLGVRRQKRARVEAAAGRQESEVMKAIRQRAEAKPASARKVEPVSKVKLPLDIKYGPSEMELLRARFLAQKHDPALAEKAEQARKHILSKVMQEKMEEQARTAKKAEPPASAPPKKVETPAIDARKVVSGASKSAVTEASGPSSVSAGPGKLSKIPWGKVGLVGIPAAGGLAAGTWLVQRALKRHADRYKELAEAASA